MPIRTRGFGFPINTNGQFPFLTPQQDERLIKNNVLHNVMTVPGERVHRPNYGTNISSTLFRSVTSDISIDLKTEVIGQVPDNDPRLIVKSINIVNGTNNTTNIDILVAPRQSPEENIEVRRLIRRSVSNNE
jgi:phage baseplate assembly protein W